MTIATLAAVSILASGALPDDDEYKIEKGTGHCSLILTMDGDPHALAASPDGTTLVVGAKDVVYFVAFSGGKLLRSVEVDSGYVRGLAYSPDGSKVAAAAVGGVYVIDAASGKILCRAEGHTNIDPGGRKSSSAYGVVFSKDGSTVVTVSQDDGKVMSWATADGSPKKKVDSGVDYLERIVNAGEGYVVSDSHTIIRYDAQLKEVWKVRGRVRLETIGVSPDGKTLALGTAGGGASVGFLDAVTGEKKPGGLIAGSTGGTKGLAITPDGKYIVSSTTRRGAVRAWKAADGSGAVPIDLDKKFETQKDSDKGLVIGLGGKVVAVAGDDDDQVRIYRLPK